MLSEIHNAHEDLRSLDKQEQHNNGTDKYILLDLSKEMHYQSIMRQVLRSMGPAPFQCYVF